MDPITIAAILSCPKVRVAIESFAKDAVGPGKQALIRRFQPTAREKAAKEAIKLFSEQWDEELEATSIFGAAIDPLRAQLKRLVETAAAEIVLWMDPETKEVDLSIIASTWVELKLDPLPGDFKWTRVAETYARAIKKYIKNDPELRDAYDIALQERQVEALEHLAPPDPGFDLTAYRQFLVDKKCNALQLAVMHSSTYEFDRKVTLWSVFVPQTARESAPIPEIPPELQRRLREQGHLTQSADQEELAELRKRYQSSPVRPVLEILDRNPQVVVVGDPGSGKTSLLKYRSLRWAKEDLGPLPLLVDLKEYVKDRKGILEYCQSAQEVFRLNGAELRKRLQTGQAAFYLDGLDEIFDPVARQSVIEEIVVLSADHVLAPIVVTSRKVGYEPERLRNAGFLHATLEEFDLPQMLEFLRQWHRIAEADDKERVLMRERLERALRESPAIRELAGNPLLLTMMAILNRNQELPRYRVDLYREASRVLLNDWDARRALPVGEFDREDKEALLRDLAGEMQQSEGGLAGNLIEQSRLKERIREFLERLHVQESRAKANQLIQQLADRSFILAYAGADRFSFVHRTFLEYYCADWFVDRFQKKQDLTFEQLKTDVFGRHWKDEKWHEVLRLIAGKVGEKKAEELILSLMAQDGRGEKLANLMLAVGCLNEVRNRGTIQATARKLWQRLQEEAIRFDPPYFYYPTHVFDECGPTRQAAVRWMALAWKGETARAWLRSAAVSDSDGIVRQAAVQELARGWKGDPETLTLLKESVRNDENNAVRQAAVQELARGWRDDPETLLLLKDCVRNDQDSDVRQAAVQELARRWKDDPETLTWLKDRVRNDGGGDVRRAAVEALARGWKDDPETLTLLKDCARNDGNNSVRWAAVQELARGWEDDPETLTWLKDRVRNDENGSLRQAAVEELARGWRDDPETLTLLKDRAQNDENGSVRQAAVQEFARGWKDDPETLTWLKGRARNDGDHSVRWAAVQEFARGWKDDPETLTWLKDRVRNDGGGDVRRAAVEALARGWKDDPETLTLLKDRVRNDENWAVRQAAVQELARGWKDDPETLTLLKDGVRNDEICAVRCAAVEALARGWKDNPETLTLLKDRVRNDKEFVVRHAAVQELARGWKDDPETLTLLKDRVRNDENGSVRLAAVQGLARGWKDDPETLTLLKDRVRNDENGSVRLVAMQELARGWKDDPETLTLLIDRVRNDESGSVRLVAMQELAQGWRDDPESLTPLKDRARSDQDNYVRQAAVQELARGWKDDSEVADFLRGLN